MSEIDKRNVWSELKKYRCNEGDGACGVSSSITNHGQGRICGNGKASAPIV